MYPELKIKNCKKKSSTYAFYFYSPSYFQYIIYRILLPYFRFSNPDIKTEQDTARTARYSKKSLGSNVGEIKKMSEKLKNKSVLTPRNVREKSNTLIYYKTPTLTIKRHEIKKWDINLYVLETVIFDNMNDS